MISVILFLACILIELFLLWLTKVASKKTSVILKIFAIVFALIYAVRLVTTDAFDNILQLNCTYLSPVAVVFMLLLRASTLVCVMVTALTPFYKSKTTLTIINYIVPVIVILNIVFFYQNIQCISGTTNVDFLNFRSIQFAIECVLMGVISSFYFIKSVKLFNKKEFG